MHSRLVFRQFVQGMAVLFCWMLAVLLLRELASPSDGLSSRLAKWLQQFQAPPLQNTQPRTTPHETKVLCICCEVGLTWAWVPEHFWAHHCGPKGVETRLVSPPQLEHTTGRQYGVKPMETIWVLHDCGGQCNVCWGDNNLSPSYLMPSIYTLFLYICFQKFSSP